jgi:hypothetical protein
MNQKNQNDLHKILATVVAAAGFAVSVGATAKVAGHTGKVSGPPRGLDILPIAGQCNIGTFPQTTKVGRYNVLCNTMADSEKCLAFIKGHFDSTGASTETADADRLTYCLDELGKVLGADEAP